MVKPTVPPLIIRGIKTGQFRQKTTISSSAASTATENENGSFMAGESSEFSPNWAPDCHRLNEWCNSEFDQGQQNNHKNHPFGGSVQLVQLPGESTTADTKMSPKNNSAAIQQESTLSNKKMIIGEGKNSRQDILSIINIPSTSSTNNIPSTNTAASKIHKGLTFSTAIVKPPAGKKNRKHRKPGASGLNKRRSSSRAASQNVRHPKITYNIESDWIPQDNGTLKLVYQSNDHFPIKRVCYESIRHRRAGDVELRERDCVEVYSDERSSYIGKIARLYHEPTTGELTASLLWYYRPEQVDLEDMDENQIKTVPLDVGKKELFTSRHFDTISVDSVQRICFVLTFNEYIRNAKENLEDKLGAAADSGWLRRQDELISYGDAAYPRRSRQPNDETPNEVVYYARRLYDFAGKRFSANPTNYNNNNNNRSHVS